MYVVRTTEGLLEEEVPGRLISASLIARSQSQRCLCPPPGRNLFLGQIGGPAWRAFSLRDALIRRRL